MGAPHRYFAEPGMYAIRPRTSTNIWHQVDVNLSCEDGEGIYTFKTFLGSAFPSRKLWINRDLVKSLDLNALSDLWNPDPTDATFVAP